MRNTGKKYIRSYSGGIEILIRRGSKVLHRRFSARTYGSLAAAEAAATSSAEQLHMEHFGCPLTNGFTHIRKRGASDTDIPPGISREYDKSKLLRYFVCSAQHNGRVQRIRFNIKKLGEINALIGALDARSKAVGVPLEMLTSQCSEALQHAISNHMTSSNP